MGFFDKLFGFFRRPEVAEVADVVTDAAVAVADVYLDAEVTKNVEKLKEIVARSSMNAVDRKNALAAVAALESVLKSVYGDGA